MNTLHEKFKFRYDTAIEDDDSDKKIIENMCNDQDMARELKLKGAKCF